MKHRWSPRQWLLVGGSWAVFLVCARCGCRTARRRSPSRHWWVGSVPPSCGRFMALRVLMS